MDEARRVGVRLARAAALAAILVPVVHGAAWWVASGLVQGRLAQVRGDAAALIDLHVGGVGRTGYPLAAGTLWRDVEVGPRGLPFGARMSTTRVAFTLVPSWRHAPVYRATLPDPVRIVLANGVAIALTASDARVEAAWAEPGTATLTATALVVTGPGGSADVARLHASLRSAARALEIQAGGVVWRPSPIALPPPALRPTALPPPTLPPPALRPAALPPIAAVSAELALDGPPPPLLADGGPALRDELARWRDGGGAVRLVRAAISWGPADLEAQGRGWLDAQLQPAATGELRVAGGAAGVRALAASGLLTSRAAQAAGALMALVPATAEVAGRDAVRLPVAIEAGRFGVLGFWLFRLAPLGLP